MNKLIVSIWAMVAAGVMSVGCAAPVDGTDPDAVAGDEAGDEAGEDVGEADQAWAGDENMCCIMDSTGQISCRPPLGGPFGEDYCPLDFTASCCNPAAGCTYWGFCS